MDEPGLDHPHLVPAVKAHLKHHTGKGKDALLFHSTPGAAMRYQRAAADRDSEIARRLSALVSEPDGTVLQ